MGRAIIVACVIAVVLGAAVAGGAFTHQSASTADSTSPHIERTATVSYVVDGDTIQLEGGEKLRLVGIDTPEMGSKEELGGREAKTFVEDLCPPGTEIGLDVDDLKREDRYGRTLAVVYVKTGGSWMNLNAELLRKGLAQIMHIPPSEFNPYKWA